MLQQTVKPNVQDGLLSGIKVLPQMQQRPQAILKKKQPGQPDYGHVSNIRTTS
jgi:hypothetical protein